MAKAVKKTEPKVTTPVLSGVVTVIGLRSPYKEGAEYQMQSDHAKIIIQKQLVKLK